MLRRSRHSVVEGLEARTIFSISFLPAVQSPVGPLGPLATGDFTGDGAADVVALNTATNQVKLYPGLGNGQFVPTATAIPLDAGTNVVQLLAGDVNRDGKLDVVAVNGRSSSGAGGVTVLLGQGGLAFAPAQHYPAGPSPKAAAIGDFNRDGRPDLAVANDALWPASTPTAPQGFGAGILLGTNAGFQPVYRLPLTGPTVSVAAPPAMPSLTAVNAASTLALAGANLLVASPLPVTSVYLFPTGLSIAAVPPISVALMGESRGLAVADLNRDGRADVVALQALGANATNASAITVHSVVSRAATTTTAPYGYAPIGPFATGLSESARPGLAVGDFDTDGRLDAAVAGIRPAGPMLPAFQGGVAVLPGRGFGYFAAASFFATGAQPLSLAVVDANRDRRPDILTGSAGGVSALLNRSTPSTNARESIDLDAETPELAPSLPA